MLKNKILLVVLKMLSNIILIQSKLNSSMSPFTKLKPIILEGKLVDKEGNYLLIRVNISKEPIILSPHYNIGNEIVVHSINSNVKLDDKVRVQGYLSVNHISPSIEGAIVKKISTF